MKHEICHLDRKEFLVLSMALRALLFLRLNPRLALSDPSAPEEVVDFMNQLANSFVSMCCDLDLMIDEPDVLVGHLLDYVDFAAEETVYQSYCDDLKCLNSV